MNGFRKWRKVCIYMYVYVYIYIYVHTVSNLYIYFSYRGSHPASYTTYSTVFQRPYLVNAWFICLWLEINGN